MQQGSRLRMVGVLGLALVLQASFAQATTMRTASIVDLIDQAESIVVAEVLAVEDGFDSRNLPYTDITLNVVDDLTGGKTGIRIIRQFGLTEPKQMSDGRTALTTTPPSFPRFLTDEKVILFLYRQSPMTSMQTTVGLLQGKFTVDGRGLVTNAVDNVNLFHHVAARADRMPESAQKLVRTSGGIREDQFVSFVRSAVEQRWVEEGVLYHED